MVEVETCFWSAFMTYVVECWPIKKQHIHKMDVAEMRMLRWMCSKTTKDKIRKKPV